MGSFFNIDGPFQKYGTIVADVMLLSLIWYVLSIPLFTIGATTTAMFYIFTKRANDRDEYLIKPFFHSFKNNFLQSLFLTLIFGACFFLIFSNIRIINSGILSINPTLQLVILLVQFSIAIELFFTSLYAFPVLSRYELKNKDVLKTSFFLANKHLLTTISLVGLFVVIYFLIFYVHGIFIFAAPGIYGFLGSKLLVKIFKKYSPDMDKYADEPIKNEPKDDLARRVIESGRYIPEETTSETIIPDQNVDLAEKSKADEILIQDIPIENNLNNKSKSEIDEKTEEELDLKFIMSKDDLKKQK